MIYNKIYDMFRRSPRSIRKLIHIIPMKYRLGGSDFSEMYSLLHESESWQESKLKQYQAQKLDDLLTHAVENVPFYSDIDLIHDDPFENLKRFPIIDKDTIQEQKDDFFAKNIPRNHTYEVTTGGTSGNPLQFRLDNSTYSKEWAFIMTGWRRVGYSPGDKMISFRGVEFTNADNNIYWQHNPIYNTVEMSPFHLTQENMTYYINKIKEVNPDFIHGYPSAITSLATYVKNEVDEFPEITAVLAASENLYSQQREMMENAFKTRVFSHYGLSEKVVLAAECEYSSQYHIYPEYSITEIVDEEGTRLKNGERGEIVGTSLMNKSMPFIRYRTDDYGAIVNSTCDCGRSYPLLTEVQGKGEKEKVVYKSDGSTFPIHAVYHTMHGNTLENVNRIQFIQTTPGEIIIRVVPNSGYSKEDEQKIIQDIQRKCGKAMSVIVNPVEEVELTDRGKQPLLLQRVE